MGRGTRRCAACTRRCSFHQARTSGLVAADWAAAALLTTPLLTPPLKSLWLIERLSATVTAAPAAPTKQAKMRSDAFTPRAFVSAARAAALFWRATPWKLVAAAQ